MIQQRRLALSIAVNLTMLIIESIADVIGRPFSPTHN